MLKKLEQKRKKLFPFSCKRELEMRKEIEFLKLQSQKNERETAELVAELKVLGINI